MVQILPSLNEYAPKPAKTLAYFGIVFYCEQIIVWEGRFNLKGPTAQVIAAPILWKDAQSPKDHQRQVRLDILDDVSLA